VKQKLFVGLTKTKVQEKTNSSDTESTTGSDENYKDEIQEPYMNDITENVDTNTYNEVCLFCSKSVSRSELELHIRDEHKIGLAAAVDKLIYLQTKERQADADQDDSFSPVSDEIADNTNKHDIDETMKDRDVVIFSAQKDDENLSCGLSVIRNLPTKLNFKNIPDYYSLAERYPDKEKESMETEEHNCNEQTSQNVNKDIANKVSLPQVSEKKSTDCVMDKENVSPDFKKTLKLPQYIPTDSCQILNSENTDSSSVSSKLVMDLDFGTENIVNITDNMTAVEDIKELDPKCSEEYDDILQLEMNRNDLQSEISKYQIETDLHHEGIIIEDPNWSGSLFDGMSTGSCSTPSDQIHEKKRRKTSDTGNQTKALRHKQSSDSSTVYSDTESWLRLWEEGNLSNIKSNINKEDLSPSHQ